MKELLYEILYYSSFYFIINIIKHALSVNEVLLTNRFFFWEIEYNVIELSIGNYSLVDFYSLLITVLFE